MFKLCSLIKRLVVNIIQDVLNIVKIQSECVVNASDNNDFHDIYMYGVIVINVVCM